MHAPRLLVLAVAFAAPAGAAAAQVSLAAAGSILSTTNNPFTVTQSLPPGSPLTNGTSVASGLSSVSISLATSPSPTVLARFTVTESSNANITVSYPASSSTSCAVVMSVATLQPMWAQLRFTWNFSVSVLGTPPWSTVLAFSVDYGNDGIVEFTGNASAPSPQYTGQVVLLGPTPTLIGVNSATGTLPNIFSPYSTSTVSSQWMLEVLPVAARCLPASYGTPCGSTLSLTDTGGGILQIAPTLASSAPGDPVALVFGLQQQITPLPFGSSCVLSVLPAVALISILGTGPVSWTLDAHAPIGSFAFYLQVLHLDAGNLYASNPLAVSCQ